MDFEKILNFVLISDLKEYEKGARNKVRPQIRFFLGTSEK
jgi:hypothetical protein